MITKNYNPDVLSCVANLSNDEIFTPPKLANDILDMLPQELFQSKKTTFLDPVTKSGVFLREIAKRLNNGLKNQIPNQQERINHIFTKQIHGIATTELTALLARRSAYCAKEANSKYSVCTALKSEQGNIKYSRLQHTWKNGKCIYCGASEKRYSRTNDLETYAYQFIHTGKPQKIFNMKFDVIIGNPPYQLETSGHGRQARPIYHLFVEQAKKLNPKYLIMIIPSRWFSGGMNLDNFRQEMLSDKRIKRMVDYSNSKDCFPGVSVSGGVNYFLWERGYEGACEFTNVSNGKVSTSKRYLDSYSTLIRYNEAISIIDRISEFSKGSFSSLVSSINVFNLSSSFRGSSTRRSDQIKVLHSKGHGYIEYQKIKGGISLINKYKVVVSRTISEHAGEPSKDGKYKVFAKTLLLNPGEICTHSYLIVANFDAYEEAKNCLNFVQTKLCRFLVLQTISGIDLSKDKFKLVPNIDFKESVSEAHLKDRFGITEKEQYFIDSLIRPID